MRILIGVIIGALVGGGIVWGYDSEWQMNEWNQQQQLRDLQFQQQRQMQEEFMREQRQQHNPC